MPKISERQIANEREEKETSGGYGGTRSADEEDQIYRWRESLGHLPAVTPRVNLLANLAFTPL